MGIYITQDYWRAILCYSECRCINKSLVISQSKFYSTHHALKINNLNPKLGMSQFIWVIIIMARTIDKLFKTTPGRLFVFTSEQC